MDAMRAQMRNRFCAYEGTETMILTGFLLFAYSILAVRPVSIVINLNFPVLFCTVLLQ